MNILGCVEMWICGFYPHFHNRALAAKKCGFVTLYPYKIRKCIFLIFFAKKFAKPKMFDVSLHRISEDTGDILQMSKRAAYLKPLSSIFIETIY